MASYSYSCHFKDYRIRMTHSGCCIHGVALGEGNIDLHAIARILQESTHLERLFIEIPMPPEAGMEKERQAIRNSLQFCKTLLN